MTEMKELLTECRFRTSRSGGSGGQHVNKVSTRVELLFNIRSSAILSDTEKERVTTRLSSRISDEGVLRVVCSDTRSQFKNREIVCQRFLSLIEQAIRIQAKRIQTTVPYKVRKKRLDDKKIRSVFKKMRKAPEV